MIIQHPAIKKREIEKIVKKEMVYWNMRKFGLIDTARYYLSKLIRGKL